MATASSRTDPLAVAAWREGDDATKSDRYLAERLAAAGADVKGVAVTTFALGAAVALMAWFGLGIAADHWLIEGGLPAWARWTWLVGGAVALGAAIVRWIVPLVRYRVNLVFAARTIERDHPDLHNDLVNTVLLKARPESTVAPVVRTLERRAARRLSTVPSEGLIDRTLALRLALGLAALVVLAGVYTLLAPKSILTTAARLVAPWARIAPPTRVSIEPPRLAWRRPGEPPAEADHPTRALAVVKDVATVVRGRQVVVATAIRGLRGDERATLRVLRVGDDDRGWSTAMTSGRGDSGGADRYVVTLPDDDRGVDQPIEFVIAAGDARTERLRVAVVDTPTLLVRQVRYEYPAYTGRAPDTVEWQGDLRAVEGTQVTVVAESNGPLDAAWVDLDCDGTNDVELAVGRQDPTRATGAFRLRLDAERKRAWRESYRFVFVPGVPGASRADAITEALEHRIEVLPDLAPEVAIEEPTEAVVVVPPDAPVPIRVRALDPDFGLARVDVEVRVPPAGGRPPIPLLAQTRSGPFRGTARLVPADVGAAPGAVIEYRAVATDTRPDEPNVATSKWQTLRVDARAAPRRQPDPPPPDAAARPNAPEPAGAKPDRTDDPPPKDDSGDDGSGGDRPDGAEGAGEKRSPGKDAAPEDRGQKGDDAGREPGRGQPDRRPSTDPKKGDSKKGDANGDPKDSNQPESGASDDARTDGKDGAAGESPIADGSDSKPRGESRGARDTVAADGTDDGRAIEKLLDDRQERQRQERQSPERTPQPQPNAPSEKGSDGADQPQPGQGQPGQGQPGQGQPGQGQPGQGQPGQGQPGQGQPGQGQPGQGQPGQGQPGQGQPGQGQPGQGQPGQGQPGQGQPGQGQPGQGQPGQGQPGQGDPQSQSADGAVGGGGAVGGDRAAGNSADGGATGQPDRREMEWTDADLSHARNAADLAIEHLRDSLASGRTDVLDSLGWTPEQARAFLSRWEEMRRRAESPDPRRRADFEQALRSLGLRADGSRSSRDVPADVKGGQAEGRRSRPPASYREQFEAYLRGTAGE